MRYVKSKKPGTLNITSLMDVMTIILVYLLKSFSSEGQILTNAENLVLPMSSSRTSPKEVSLGLYITYDWILVDNIPIVKTSEVRNNKWISSVAGISVTPIKEKLEKTMEIEKNMVKRGALERVKGEIVMQIDKNIAYDVLYKIMATCGEVGYNHMRFAVMGKPEGE